MKIKMNREGFTLLEMVIVICIISILFLLTVPNIQKVIGIVGKKGCSAQLKVVDSAILQYQLDFDEMPSSISDLVQAGLLTEQQAECQGGEAISIQDGQASAG